MAKVRNKGTEVLDLDTVRITGKVKRKRIKSTFIVFLSESWRGNGVYHLIGLNSVPVDAIMSDGTIHKQPVSRWSKGRQECLTQDLSRVLSNYKFVKVGGITYQVENKKDLSVKLL